MIQFRRYTFMGIVIPMKIRLNELRNIIREVLEDELEDKIEELQTSPEFQNVQAFVDYKVESEEYEYDFAELQALARNEVQKKVGGKKLTVSIPPQGVIDKIRKELEGDWGFKFIGRAVVHKGRGFTSPSHGKHPGSGMSSGSGMGSNITGPVGFGMGGGPGAMGGGYKWDASSSRNLSMGAGRKGR